MATAAYNAWVAAGRPNNGPIRPLKMLRDRLRRYGYTVYDLGDTSHQTHNPPEDHTCFAATGWPVTAQRWWIHAIDIMPPKPGSGLPSLQRLGAQLLADKKAGIFHPLKYMNWEPERDWGGACYQERFMPDYQRRSSSDRGHIHLSGRSDMVAYAGADSYDPVARLRGESTTTQGDDDMATSQEIWTHDLQDDVGGVVKVEPAYRVLLRAADGVTALKADVAALKARPAVDPAQVVAALAADGGFVDRLAAAVAAQVTLNAGPTAAQVRQIVDEELDEQSRGGADTDAP